MVDLPKGEKWPDPPAPPMVNVNSKEFETGDGGTFVVHQGPQETMSPQEKIIHKLDVENEKLRAAIKTHRDICGGDAGLMECYRADKILHETLEEKWR